MNYCCFIKEDNISQIIKENIISKLESKGWLYTKEDPKIIITIGGDGTVLAAASKYLDILEKVVFVGVHTGSLGFFNDFEVKEVDNLIELITTQKPIIERKRLVKATFNNKVYHALNEIRIENNIRTQVLDVKIDDQYFETFRGAGLCFSTQAGSTAYNRSINGAILDTKLQTWQLSEIIPIKNMHYRTIGTSIVLNPDRVIEITSLDFKDSVLAYDHLYVKIQDGDKIICTLSEKYLNFANYKDIDYYTKLKTLF